MEILAEAEVITAFSLLVALAMLSNYHFVFLQVIFHFYSNLEIDKGAPPYPLQETHPKKYTST
mgnify:CR=1 FL=1